MFSIFGPLLGCIIVFLAAAWEGLAFRQIFSLGAMILVLVLTFLAVSISYGVPRFIRSIQLLFQIAGGAQGVLLSEKSQERIIDEFILLSAEARKNGLNALAGSPVLNEDYLLKNVIKYASEGYDHRSIHELVDSAVESETLPYVESESVLQFAASIAPGMGMLGAVLGLMLVLNTVDQPSAVGPGIAIAFISTLYGLMLTNLFFQPWVGVMQRRVTHWQKYRAALSVGVSGLLEGQSPEILKQKMNLIYRSQWPRS